MHAADVLGEEVFAVEVVVAHAGFFHVAAFGCGGSGGGFAAVLVQAWDAGTDVAAVDA